MPTFASSIPSSTLVPRTEPRGVGVEPGNSRVEQSQNQLSCKGSTSTTCFFYDLSQLSLFGIPGPSSIALSKNKVVANRWQRGGSKHPHPGCEILHDIGIN